MLQRPQTVTHLAHAHFLVARAAMSDPALPACAVISACRERRYSPAVNPSAARRAHSARPVVVTRAFWGLLRS